MIRLLAVLAILLQWPAPPASASGTLVGNGGHAVVCRDTHGGIREAFSFDLFEGKTLFGYTAETRVNLPSLEIALKTANPLLHGEFSALADRLRFVKKVMTPGGKLSLSEDIHPLVMPTGCALEQAVLFYDDLRVVYDQEIWAALAPISRAALLLHEAIYWHLREHGKETDSRRTRRIVAFLFSGQTNSHPIFPSSFDLSFQYCRSRDKSYEFFAYTDPIGKPQLLFFRRQSQEVNGHHLAAGAYSRACATPTLSPMRGEGWLEGKFADGARLSLRWGEGGLLLQEEFNPPISVDCEIQPRFL